MTGADKGKRKQDERSPQSEYEVRVAKKRMEDMDTGFDVCSRLTEAVDKYKVSVSGTLTAMEVKDNPTNEDMKKWIVCMAKHQVRGLEGVANIVAEVVMEMQKMDGTIKEKDSEIKRLKEEMNDQKNVVKTVSQSKDNIEIKASSKDMEDRLRVSLTQFKVMDIEIGKETDDRRELISKGMEDIRKKVRSDQKEAWDKLADGVDVIPLVKKSAKQTGSDKYTAPFLFTVQERSKKWKMEDILRSSKIYPGFHWPQEMMSVMKGYRKVLTDNGVNEDAAYIRIRPQERDGRIRIKADVKPKEGNGRFTAKASWEAPPLDGEIRKKAKDHMKPTWASVARP
jgi:hypothetical protein